MTGEFCYICNLLIDGIASYLAEYELVDLHWPIYTNEELFTCDDCSSIVCFDHFVEIPYRTVSGGIIMEKVCDTCQISRLHRESEITDP